jgi:hypothetical protein
MHEEWEFDSRYFIFLLPFPFQLLGVEIDERSTSTLDFTDQTVTGVAGFAITGVVAIARSQKQ